MAGKKFDLSLVIKAVDQATAPLRAVNQRIKAATAPIRQLNNSLRALAREAHLPRLVKATKGVGSAFMNVGREVLSLGAKITALSTAAGFAIWKITQSAMQAGDDLLTISERLGMGVDSYAQLQFAAAQADVEQEAFNKSMDQFTKRLGEAKAGTGALVTLLNKASPALLRQLQGTKSVDEALGLMAEAFKRLPDAQRRAALASAAFGRSGLQMGVFLASGRKEIDKQRAKYFELMGSQQKFAEGAGELDNALRETGLAFTGLRNAAMAELFPAFTELARALRDFMATNRDKIQVWARDTAEAISQWVRSGGIDRLAAGMKSLGEGLKSVVDKLGGLKGIGAIFGVLAGAKLAIGIGKLVVAVKGLGIALGATSLAVGAATLGAIAAALIGIGAALYQIHKHWKGIKELFADWGGRGGLPATLHAMRDSAQEWAQEAGSEPFGFAPKTPVAYRPSWPAPASRIPDAPAAAPAQAHVTIDINGLPPGARVKQEQSTTHFPLDLNLGYTMMTP